MNRSDLAPEAHVSCKAQTKGSAASVPVVVFSAILFLSGIGALIFETLWLRLSGLAFGNSVWAAALILSSFYGRAGPGERDRRNIENSAMATAPSLRVAGGATTHSCLPIYCLNGSVQKAETLAANNAALIKRNWFVDWLWEKLETDFGFHPPD